MEDLQSFIKEQDRYFKQKFPELFADPEKAAYARTTKLLEEAGELSEAVLHHFNKQRRSKDTKDMSIGAEVVDVIIVVLLLAKQMDIDVNAEITAKIKKLEQRRAEI